MSPNQLTELKALLERRMNDPVGDVISASNLANLDEARNYDAVSSYNYLFAELMTIKQAVARGRIVTVATVPPQMFDSVDAFMKWALARYPAFSEAAYHDLYVDPVDLVGSTS